MMNEKRYCRTSASSHWRMLRPGSKSRSTLLTAERGLRLLIWSMGRKQNFRARSGETISTRSRCKQERIICRHCARFSNNASDGSVFDEQKRKRDGAIECLSNDMNSSPNTPSLHYSLGLMTAADFHDIAPPVDYSLISPWLVFLMVFAGLSLLGLLVW